MTLDTQAMKQIVRDIFEQGWNRQQFDQFAPYLADTVIFNYRGARQPTNLEGLKGLVAIWRSAFPDLRFEVIDVIAEQNLAAVNLLLTGTQLGPWQGIEPTGAVISVEEMMFMRFADGRIVELWEVFDEATMLKQLDDYSG